jgi:hypothetical protein
MGIDPQNTDVFQLLEKLKEANGTYPQELLALRRQGYLKQVAAVSGGAGLAMALKNTAKGAKGTALPPAASSVLEGILVVAIIAEAGAAAYFYRDKIADLFHSLSGSPKVEEVANPPVASSPIPGLEIGLTPVLTVTETATPISTPSPLLAEQATQNGTSQESQANPSNPTEATQGGSPAVSTPDVNDNTNNGNHYGNTPIPERTKEPGNDTSTTNNTTNDSSKPKKKP